MTNVQLFQDWVVLPPGNVAICRTPQPSIPDGAQLASARDVLVANLGYPFPWGSLPEPSAASRLWKEQRIGMGGLRHTAWFVTSDGRVGGAPNVPEKLPGSLRSCLLYEGGGGHEAENEGYAVIRSLAKEDQLLYRRLQLHAAEHVAADRGSLIMSPIGSDKTVHLGFGGRCLQCPSPELISFRQAKQAVQEQPSEELARLIRDFFPDLQRSFAEYTFVLYPEWRHWVL